MAERAEAQAQLSRLLGDESLRFSPLESLRATAATRLAELADALAAETAASDDVSDTESARAYADRRIEFLEASIGEEAGRRLRQEVFERIDRW